MRDDGIQRAAVITTSAYSSYSSCRQYRENLADAVAEVEGAPRLERLRQYYNHPGFVEPVVDATLAAMADLPDAVREGAELVFVTHSIPTAMAETSGPPLEGGNAYVRQHLAVAEEITGAGAPGDRPPPQATTSSTARAPARRGPPGWSPTSTTTSPPSPSAGSPPS